MKTTIKQLIALTLALLLLVCLFSCDSKKEAEDTKNDVETPSTNNDSNASNDTAASEDTVSKTGVWENATYLKDMTFGEGKTAISVVVKAEKQSITFTLNTDKTTLADALLEHSLISGDQGDYGLYVKKVNGILADYNVDQTYWALYINGEYAMSGVDSTEILEGTVYTLERTK